MTQANLEVAVLLPKLRVCVITYGAMFFLLELYETGNASHNHLWVA